MQKEPPDDENLRIMSFAAHSARGLLRHRALRRKTMFGAVVVAVALMVCGSTILAATLNPHERPVWFILYWFVCAWVTVLALLLAVFDLLLVRRDARESRRDLRRNLSGD